MPSVAANETAADAPPAPVSKPRVNCDDAWYPVCDGFGTVAEGALPDANRWNANPNRAPGQDEYESDHPDQTVLEMSRTEAHSGNQSLHVHTVGGTEHRYIEAVTSTRFPRAFLPAPNNTFYERLWLKDAGLGDDASAVVDGHLYIVNASGQLAGRQQYLKFGGNDEQGSQLALGINARGPTR